MKIRPILFTPENAKKSYLGSKTETRREVKPQPPQSAPSSIECEWLDGTTGTQDYGFSNEDRIWKCPYGGPGDRLWVREAFYIDHYEYLGALTGLPPLTAAEQKNCLYYAADGPVHDQIPECEGIPKLKPAIFMPRWASRTTLEIVSVRVERLQNITETDAIAEGIYSQFVNVEPLHMMKKWVASGVKMTCANGDVSTEAPAFLSAKDAYRALWNSINGKDAWGRNPFVWVLGYKRIFD